MSTQHDHHDEQGPRSATGRRAMRRHVWVMVGVGLACVATVAGLNALADPYGAWPTPGLDGLVEARKVRGRVAKAERLTRGDCQVLLIGSSRAESALDPAHAAWGGRSVVNMGLNRYNAAETEPILDLAMRHNKLDHVVIGVDFFGFSRLRGVDGDFDASLHRPAGALDARRTGVLDFERSRLNPGFCAWQYRAFTLLGRDTTSDSLKVIERAITGEPTDYTSRGFHVFDVEAPGAARRFRSTIRRYLTWSNLYGDYRAGPRHLAAVVRSVRRCREAGVAVTLVILPVHALQLEAIDAAGLWPAFEQWKKDVAAMVGRVGGTAGDAGLPSLWDFQGYHRFATEPIPGVDSAGKTMRYFWEASHCTKTTGDMVIDRVFGRAREDVPTEFGVRINDANIDAHLSRIRQGRQAYRASHAKQIAFFKDVIASVGD